MDQLKTKARCATTGEVEHKTFMSNGKTAAMHLARRYYDGMKPLWWSVTSERHVVPKACTFNGATDFERVAQ